MQSVNIVKWVTEHQIAPRLIDLFFQKSNFLLLAYRKRDKREPREVDGIKPLIEEKLAVQRLQLIYSSDESTGDEASGEKPNMVGVKEEDSNGVKCVGEGVNDVKDAVKN